MKKIKLFLLPCAAFFLSFCSNIKKEDSPSFKEANLNQLAAGITAVNPPTHPVGPTSATPIKGILAIKSIEIGEQAAIASDISVLSTCHGNQCLAGDAELTFGEKTSSAPGYTVKADNIKIKEKANIRSRLEANHYQVSPKAIAPNRNALGALPELPMFLNGTPGSADVRASATPLAAGRYRKLILAEKKSLMLAGGFYQFSEIEIGEKASLVCATNATCTVLVKNTLKIGEKAAVRPTSTSSNDLTFYVEEPTSSSDIAAKIGEKSNITANIYAANGLLKIGERVEANGIFIGKYVKIGEKANVTGSALPANSVSKLFEAGKAASIEIPGKVKLSLPACALANDAIITVSERAGNPDAAVFSPGYRHHGPTFEMLPHGLSFNCEANVSLAFDQKTIVASGGDVNKLAVADSPDGLHWNSLAGQNAAANISANIWHFSYYGIVTVLGGGTQATIEGNFLYAADNCGGVSLSNISDPLQRTQIGGRNRYLSPDYPYETCGRGHVAVKNDFVFVHQRGYTTSSGSGQWWYYPLHVYQRTATGLVFVRQFYFSGWHQIAHPVEVYDMVMSGDNLYMLATNSSGSKLHRISIANPANPVLTGEINLPPNYYALYASGNYLYLVGGSIAQIDTGTFSLMSEISAGIGYNSITGLAISGNYAYAGISDGSAGSLAIYQLGAAKDVQIPPVTQTLMSQRSNKIAVYGGYLFSYGLDTTGGPSQTLLQVSDISDPVNPVEKRIIPTSFSFPAFGYPYDVLVPNSKYAYLSQGYDGVLVIDLSPLNPAPVPSIVSVVPADGGIVDALHAGPMNDPLFIPFRIEFDQPMDVSTLSSNTDESCSGTIQVSSDNFTTCVPMSPYTAAAGEIYGANRIIILRNVAPLTGGKIYKVKVTSAVKSANGALLPADYVQTDGWLTVPPNPNPSFTVSAAPAEGLTNVPLGSAIQLTFTNSVVPSSVTASVTSQCTGSVQVSANNFSSCVPMNSVIPVLSGANRVVTFQPVSLASNTVYYVKVAGTIRSYGGTILGSEYKQNTGWRTGFSTPGVTSVSPVAGASGVATSAPVIVNFSEPMHPSTVYGWGDGTCTGTVQVSSDGFNNCVPMASVFPVASNGNMTFTFTPATLSLGKTYQVKILALVSSANGITIPSDYIQSPGWTTNIPTPPAVISVSPAAGATNVPLNAPIVITFDRPMNPATLTTAISPACNGTIHIVDSSGLCAPMTSVTATMSAGDTVATFTPVGLVPGLAYFVRVTLSVQSAAGGSMISGYIQSPRWSTPVPPPGPGNLLWVRQGGGNYPAAASNRAVAVDSSGNIFVAGDTTNNLDGFLFPGQNGIFVRKYGSAGNLIWSTTYYGGAYAAGSAMAATVDPSGNVLVTGFFGTDLDGVPVIIPNSSDTFIAKIDGTTGAKLWLSTFGSVSWTVGAGGHLVPYGITTDSSGNSAIVAFAMSSVHGETFTGFGNTVVIKVDPNGNRLWTRMINSMSNGAYGIATNAAGEIFTTGSTAESIDGQPMNGSSDLMLNKFAPNGDRLWTRLFGGAGAAAEGRGVAVSAGGDIHIHARAWGSMLGQTSTASAGDSMTLKIDGSGSLIWARIHNAAPIRNDAENIALDASGNIYCVGTTHDPIFQQGQNLKMAGYLTQLDPAGNVQWTRLIGPTFQATHAVDVAVDSSGAIYVAGVTSGNIGDQQLRGLYDYFLAKFQ